MNSYSELGRRIERLFYFGAVLVLLCLALVYFVSTATYMSSRNPSGFAILEKNLVGNSESLKNLFDHPVVGWKHPSRDEMRDVQATRAKLGLPMETFSENPTNVVTYRDELNSVLKRSAAESGMSIDALSSGITGSMSPDQIIAAVRSTQKTLSETPAKIWGIETPLIVPLEYGAARYAIPASVIANSLLIAMAPLIIWWLGSFQLTRQRELILIRESESHRYLFPHILNLLPIKYMGMPWASEKERAGRNNQRRERISWQIFYSLVRSFVVVLICWPILIMYVYSGIQVIDLQINAPIVELVIASIIGLWMSFQALIILIQEWLLLWGKVFVEYWR